VPSPRRQPPRDVATFTIVFKAFIPEDHVLGPLLHPQSYRGILPPRRRAFAGDGRGFDVDATTYRALQVVTVIPDEDADADGLLEGSKQNRAGVSESFVAKLALADGRLDDRDRRAAREDGRYGWERVAADATGMIIDGPSRLGPHAVRVRFRTRPFGGPRNRMVLGSPAIDWDFTVTIDTSGAEPRYRVVGRWDGYPAAELYINRQPVFTSAPGGRSATTLELLRLLPVYGDLTIATSGALARPAPGAHERRGL
jgi:hypothetical protein